jgi:uncharacterized protein DUF397
MSRPIVHLPREPVVPDDHSAPSIWRKSSKSEYGSCVEVALGVDTVCVRNSRYPHGPVLEFPAAAWDTFVAAVRDHRYDRPSDREETCAVPDHRCVADGG